MPLLSWRQGLFHTFRILQQSTWQMGAGIPILDSFLIGRGLARITAPSQLGVRCFERFYLMRGDC